VNKVLVALIIEALNEPGIISRNNLSKRSSRLRH